MNDDLGKNRQHLFRACREAVEGDTLVDLGVRHGCSSKIMLRATEHSGAKVIGVDYENCPIFAPRYTFLQTDSVTASMMVPEELFLVFFDTLHIKEQVMTELYHYWPKIRVGGYAVFHDTNWPKWKHDVYLGRTWDQPIEGVKKFFHIESYLMGHFVMTKHIEMHYWPDSWGMTFVQKMDDWVPEVEGMEQALSDSRMLTEALCKVAS